MKDVFLESLELIKDSIKAMKDSNEMERNHIDKTLEFTERTIVNYKILHPHD